jgi:hypothetical protein
VRGNPKGNIDDGDAVESVLADAFSRPAAIDAR